MPCVVIFVRVALLLAAPAFRSRAQELKRDGMESTEEHLSQLQRCRPGAVLGVPLLLSSDRS